MFFICRLAGSGSIARCFAALELIKWYAQEHVLLCLIPAFFIAGAVGVFVSRDSVMKYLGANAPKALAYGVASVSGTILGRLLLYDSAAVFRDISDGCRARARLYVPVFRTGDQYTRDRSHGTDSWSEVGHRPGGWRDCVQHRHRPLHALPVP